MRNRLGLALALLAVCAGCGGVDDGRGAGSDGAAQVTRYDGKTLFEGFFFGQGPVAKRLPELWGGQGATPATGPELLTPDSMASLLDASTDQMVGKGLDPARAETLHALATRIRSAPTSPQAREHASQELAADFRQMVIARILQRDPSFFQRFGDRLQSGNPPDVEAALRDGANQLLDALRDSGGSQVGPTENAISLALWRQVAEAAYAVQAGAAWNIVAAYTVVAVALVVAAVLVIPAMKDPDTSNLQRAEFIGQIADRFQAPQVTTDASP